ncbi:MAG: acyl-CoA dehydrogenase family protein, partial [Pseudomonadales bacterium]
MTELADFRAELRAWLEDNCPPSMRTPMPADESPGGGRRAKFNNPETRLWLERCAELGYTVPSWPREYGGAGFNKEQTVVFQEEMRRINARPPHVGMGI